MERRFHFRGEKCSKMCLKIDRSVETPWHRPSMELHPPGYGLHVRQIANGKHWHLMLRSKAAPCGPCALTFTLSLLENLIFFHRNRSLQQFFLEHSLDLAQPGLGRLEIFRNNLSSVCDLKKTLVRLDSKSPWWLFKSSDAFPVPDAVEWFSTCFDVQ